MITTLLNGPICRPASHAELVEDERLDHLGRILLAFEHLVVDAVADVAFRALGHVVGLGGHGLQRLLAHHHVVAVEEHDAGRQLVALGVDQGDRPAAVVDPRQHGERRAQVNADGGDGRLRSLSITTAQRERSSTAGARCRISNVAQAAKPSSPAISTCPIMLNSHRGTGGVGGGLGQRADACATAMADTASSDSRRSAAASAASRCAELARLAR